MLCAIALLIVTGGLFPGGASAAGGVVEVRAADGRLLASITPGALSYPSDGSIVSVGSLAWHGGTVELDDVSLLDGRIQAQRIVVPMRGFGGASVSVLVVDGQLEPVAPNVLIPFRGSSYIVALQEAIVPQARRQLEGLVGLRVVLGRRISGLAAGSELLVGLPVRPRPPTQARPLAHEQPSSKWSVLGLVSAPILTGLTPIAEPAALAPLVPTPANDQNLSKGQAAAAIAAQYLGVPYRWGGASPATGFDCSGLAMFVYRQLGIQLTHFSGAQSNEGTPVSPSDLQPGDLIFFDPGPFGPEHEGIYIGNGRFIHAPHTGDYVKISSLADPSYALRFVAAVRPY
jgi:hypothetical protein